MALAIFRTKKIEHVESGLKKCLSAFDLALLGIGCAIGTGIFVNPALGGTGVYDYVANKVADFDATAQIIAQLWDIGITLAWSGSVAFVILIVLKYTIGIRSSDEDQEAGLDIADHGEKAYNF